LREGVTEYKAALVESCVCDTSTGVTVGSTASGDPSCWTVIGAHGGESLCLTFAFFFDFLLWIVHGGSVFM
jgi:hypothetical protein